MIGLPPFLRRWIVRVDFDHGLCIMRTLFWSHGFKLSGCVFLSPSSLCLRTPDRTLILFRPHVHMFAIEVCSNTKLYKSEYNSYDFFLSSLQERMTLSQLLRPPHSPYYEKLNTNRSLCQFSQTIAFLTVTTH